MVGLPGLLLLVFLVCIVLAIFSTWFTVKEMVDRQRKIEEMLLDIQETLRRQFPPKPATKTCIRCVKPVPLDVNKCPHCGHFFDQA